MKDEYPTGKADLMTAFMVRAQGLTVRRGTWAMINLPSWMSLKSFEDLRHDLLGSQRIASMVHLGRGIFGSDFGTVAFAIDNTPATKSARGVYRRLFEQHVDVRSVPAIEALFRDSVYNRYEVSQADFAAISGSPIVYWLSEKMRGVFATGRPLNSITEPRQGLLTGDGEAFVRQWWETSANRASFTSESRESAKGSCARWFPYNKGGNFRKWYGNHEHLVNWEDDGRLVRSLGSDNGGRVRSRPQNVGFYFRSSVSWSNVSSGSPAFRSYPPGFIAAGSTGDGVYPQSQRLSASLLGILNSSVAHEFLAATAPTITFNVGTIARLPIILPSDSEIGKIVLELVEIARNDWNQAETSWDFERNPLVAFARRCKA